MIELRSETCSRPIEAMRRAMAEAAVGGDVYSDDATVQLLEERTATLLGAWLPERYSKAARRNIDVAPNVL